MKSCKRHHFLTCLKNVGFILAVTICQSLMNVQQFKCNTRRDALLHFIINGHKKRKHNIDHYYILILRIQEKPVLIVVRLLRARTIYSLIINLAFVFIYCLIFP